MAKRFDQYCPVAHAMCLVGERWSLLIVRELLHGPKRYTDLHDGLPGIGTNILAARLRELEGGGIVRKRKLPAPAASTVYELTEYGAELEEVVYALARWGARTLGPPGPGDELYAEWGVNALPALFSHEAARGLTEAYVLRIEGDVFSARVDNGHLHVAIGAVEDADVVIETDMATFFRLTGQESVRGRSARAGPGHDGGRQDGVRALLRGVQPRAEDAGRRGCCGIPGAVGLTCATLAAR